jgi:predicted CopG family antitoxin
MNEEELEKKVKEFFGESKKTKRIITIRDETYKRLLELQAEMIQQRKERISLSQLIDFLINFYKEKTKEAKK